MHKLEDVQLLLFSSILTSYSLTHFIVKVCSGSVTLSSLCDDGGGQRRGPGFAILPTKLTLTLL